MNKLPFMLNNNMSSLRMIENKMPGDSCVGISSKTNKGVNILDNNSKISVRDKILTTRQIPIKIGKAYNINICILPHIFLSNKCNGGHCICCDCLNDRRAFIRESRFTHNLL